MRLPLRRAIRRVGRRPRAAEGFTIVEALIAMVVVVVGLLGAFLVLDVASATSAATRARSGAVNLAREITEDTRAIPFSQVAPSTIVTQLQAMPGLDNAASGSTWQISRNGFTYTVTTTECSVDDPKDRYGVHDSTFCPDSNITGTSDPNPVDLKRVTATVSWTALHAQHSITEVATLTSAGQALGLKATGLSVATPAGLANSTAPTIGSTPSVLSMTFHVTAPSGTTAIVWTVNGAAQDWSSTAPTGTGTVWTSSTPWVISNLSDGTYQIGAEAEDGSGIIGPGITIPVVLIRNIPAAPNVSWYGFNTHLSVSGSATTAAELQWQPNAEQNVVGYRIYAPSASPSGTLICTTTQGGANATSNQSCGTHAWCSTPAACIDLSPPSPTAANLVYQVAPLYDDASGALQEGPRTSVTLTGTPSNAYALAPTITNTSSNCAGSILRDMLATYTPSTTDSTASGAITFCSDQFSSGDTVEGGGRATGYFTNSGSSSCQVTATLNTDGSSTGAATATSTIPGGTSSAAAYAFTFTDSGLQTMNAGDSLNLKFDMSASTCGSTVLHYGSSGAPSAFQTSAIPVTAPGTPASLTVTTQSDGSAAVSWPESTTGAPVSFYRIYRDGQDYTSRYDYVPASDCTFGSCSYSDVKRNSSHTYAVTAVGGTTAGSNMAESPPVGPVTG